MPRCTKGLALLIGAALLQLAAPAAASEWAGKPQWVKAHEDFLASTVMHGRGSATRDEAIAAQYVAAQFESFGLEPAPGIPATSRSAGSFFAAVPVSRRPAPRPPTPSATCPEPTRTPEFCSSPRTSIISA
jgi:hypothetical protein